MLLCLFSNMYAKCKHQASSVLQAVQCMKCVANQYLYCIYVYKMPLFLFVFYFIIDDLNLKNNNKFIVNKWGRFSLYIHLEKSTKFGKFG